MSEELNQDEELQEEDTQQEDFDEEEYDESDEDYEESDDSEDVDDADEDDSDEDDSDEGDEEDGEDDVDQPSAKKGRKDDKKPSRSKSKEKARLKKEWEDSIVASKRVKREEQRRKLKRAMLIMLVFALVVTSVVYVMLLFIQENNVRITASSKDRYKAITLSMDNENWTPYLNTKGPEHMWDVSYNKAYGREEIPTIQSVKSMLSAENASNFVLGSQNGETFICFTFMLKNIGEGDTLISYEMTLENDDKGLQNAIRVMWGQSYKSDDVGVEPEVTIYASLSNNNRLAGTDKNIGRTEEDGFIEYVAYPVGSDMPNYDLVAYEGSFDTYQQELDAREAGWIATTPFDSKDYVFQREGYLAKDDIMYCFVCIWLEGSDFDCVNSILGGYCKLGINFTAY